MAQEQEKSGGLQVNEDRAWQEKFWTAQRVAWILMALIIVAAILGLTGKGGPLASATAKVPGASIEYPRVTRWESEEQLTMRLARSTSGKVEVELSPSFAELFRIDSIAPEPESVQATGNGHRSTFDIEGGGEPRIVFSLTTQKPAIPTQVKASVGGRPAELTVTVLP